MFLLIDGNIIKEIKKREKELAKKVKGKRQPASGKFSLYKGDVRTDNILFELKSTTKKSYSLKLELLKKLESQAFQMRKLPVFVIDFDGEFYFIINEKFLDIEKLNKIMEE